MDDKWWIPHNMPELAVLRRRMVNDGRCTYCQEDRLYYSNLCRNHFNERARKYRAKYPRSDAARRKHNVRSYAHVYVKRGKIKKTPCIMCREDRSEIHHPDHSRPLLVIWLCRDCHLSLHDDYGY